MWLPTTPAGLELVTSNEDTLFVLQVWHELLSPKSPDSYQARAVNLPLLFDDVLHVAEMAEHDDRWKAYLPALGYEIRERAIRDLGFLDDKPRLKHAVDSLSKNAIGQSVYLSKADAKIAKLLYGDAMKVLAEQAKSCIKKRRALHHHLSALATQLQYFGAGDDSLALVTDRMLALAPDDAITKLLEPLSTEPKTYSCTFFAEGTSVDISRILEGTEFSHLKKADRKGTQKFRNWYTENKGRLALTAKIKATSNRQAAEKGLLGLASVLNVHNLYSNSGAYQVVPQILVDTRDEVALVEVSPHQKFGLLPRRNAHGLTTDRLSSIGERLSGRLANALESYALALRASDPRTAVINLWTALETIAGPYGDRNIGDRVVSKIAPLVAWRKVDKIITYLALNCHIARKTLGKEIDESVLENSNNESISPDDVLLAITHPSMDHDNALLSALFAACGDSPLLRKRLLDAWSTFHSPAAVNKDLKETERMVGWQIQRIYRARNLLVHRGEQSHLIWRLLQNAQYYVSLSLSRIMHDLSENSSWDIDISLSHQIQRLSYLQSQLQPESAHLLTFSDFLLDKTHYPDRTLWEKIEPAVKKKRDTALTVVADGS